MTLPAALRHSAARPVRTISRCFATALPRVYHWQRF
jgi:hypothetical protein